MKKSPLSMPSGSRGNKSNNWKPREQKSKTGYGYNESDSYQCISPNGSQAHSGGDFIPLNISTPTTEQKRQSGNNWYSPGGNRNHRNSSSGGFNHYRHNYHATPKSNCNNSYSTYKHSGKQFHAQKKGYQRNTRRHVDISRYIDMKSFLEDPWAELSKNLNRSKEASMGNSPRVGCSLSSQSIGIGCKSDSKCQSATDLDSSQFSQESRNESIDESLGLNDTDVSEVSRAESSIDLKIGDIRFSQGSKDGSFCGMNDNTSKDIQGEDISLSCDIKKDTNPATK